MWHMCYNPAFPQSKRKPFKHRILNSIPSRLGEVHSMHCKILLKYYGEDQNTEILGLPLLPAHAVMRVPWLSREQLCMLVLIAMNGTGS